LNGLTDSTATSPASDFAGIGAARAEEADARRRQFVRRGLAWVAVVVVHILAIILILAGNEIPIIKRIQEAIPEAITWIPMPKKPANPPKPELHNPEVLLPEPIITAPITVPPLRMRPAPLAPPASEGLEGVGRSLACGAGSYENLPPNMREACRRQPWAWVKKPDGTIVLDATPKPVEMPTAADIMRHEQQTAPPCPVLQNVPCLGKVIHGDPLGGAPAPF
jgi:hypothetical protein